MKDPELKYPVNTNPSKSYSVFLCKTLSIALLLGILIIFPSQVPKFTNQTIVAKLWELFYLLLIGISISYGLFGRKRSEINSGIQPQLDNSKTYLSGIVDISSIFYSGYDDQCGSVEKTMTQTRDSMYFENGYENPYGVDDQIMLRTGKSQFLENECKVPRSLNSEKDLEISLFDEMSETEYCQSFHGESMAWASRENSVLHEWGDKTKWEIEYKPLGLPVRSLKSSIIDHEISECIKGNGSSPDSKGSCKNSCKSVNEKFRGPPPKNSDKKFKETVSLPYPIRWGGKSNGSGVRRDISSSLSVGKSETDHLKSQSVLSPNFLKTSPISSPTSPKENSDSENGDPERNSEASSVTRKTRGFSFGSMSEMNVQRISDEKLKGFRKSMREDPMSRGNWSVESWKSEGKPKSPFKPFLIEKSVGTIRPSENVLEDVKMGDMYSDQVEDKVAKKNNCDQFESRQNLDDFSLNQSSKLSKHQNGEFTETSEVESEKDSESEFEKFDVSSEEEENASGADLDPNEVDKKAGEFIAKFREQIWLQKIDINQGI